MISAQAFIPQRPPIVMVDDIVLASEQKGVTQFTVRPENMFVRDGRLAEPGLVENIAQTAAAMVGHLCATQNKPVPIGYIAAIKDLKIFHLPEINATLQSTVLVTNKVMEVTIMRGEITQGAMKLCECEMRILIVNQPPA